jgi:hypothetical protein
MTRSVNVTATAATAPTHIAGHATAEGAEPTVVSFRLSDGTIDVEVTIVVSLEFTNANTVRGAI